MESPNPDKIVNNVKSKHPRPCVTLIVCGRFHYHKYLELLFKRGLVNKFIYSYKRGFKFNIPKSKLRNFPAKEYMMYLGKKILPATLFYRHLSFLHSIWQLQVLMVKPGGNIAHFLIHGNCDRIIHKYKKQGIKILGEVVNVHPYVQRDLLLKAYEKSGQEYKAGEKYFEEKIIREYHLCDYLLVPSDLLKRSLVAHGIADKKIKVLPYGLNKSSLIKKVPALISRDNTIRLLCVAQLSFRKGIIYLCEALELIINAGYQCNLTLIGTIDPAYHKIIAPCLRSDLILHLTHVDNSEIEKIMTEHDLLIMPSIEDGFGIVVAEALSVQLPVIVTRNCGAVEIINQDKNGFVIEPFSSKAIADAVIKSVNYHFQFTDPVFTWENYVDKLEDIYTDILN